MIPFLYTQDYHGSGDEYRIGALPSWIDCQITEELNGEFTLEGTLPAGALNVDELDIDRIIVANVSPERPGIIEIGEYASSYNVMQPFRIRKLSKPAENVVQVTAHHVSYQLTENIIRPFSTAYSSVQTVFNTYLNASGTLTGYVAPSIGGFNFLSDVTSLDPIQITHDQPKSVRAFLGGDGGVQPLFGGEFDFDGWTVMLRDHRGTDRDVKIAYAQNLERLEYEMNADGLVTGYLGWWDGTGGYKQYVAYCDNYASFAYARVEPVDFSSEFDSRPSDADLQAATEAYRDAQNRNQLPTSITVTAVPDVLQNVFLGDSLTVLHPEYKLQQAAKVVKTVFDPIYERYNSVTIGTIQKGITDTIAMMLRGEIHELFG